MFSLKSKLPVLLQGELTIALLDKLLAMDFTNSLLRQLSSFSNKAEATDYLLKLSNLEKRVKVKGLEKIPTGCPLLVVSNHPRGVGDGLVLLFCLQAIRPDLKFVVNQLLQEIPHFNELFITRANDRKGRNFSTIRQLLSHLDEDGCICLFPAGTVEHFDWTSLSVKESPWKMNFRKMAQKSGAALIEARISSRNSFLFHCIASFSRSSRTILLLREFKTFMRQKNQKIEVSFYPFDQKNHGPISG